MVKRKREICKCCNGTGKLGLQMEDCWGCDGTGYSDYLDDVDIEEYKGNEEISNRKCGTVNNIRKFNVVVETTKEYEISIDENKINKDILDNFERYFRDLNEEEDRTKSLAHDYCKLRSKGYEGSIEGYGYVLEDGEIPLEAKFYDLKKEDINTGIDFKVIDNGEYPCIVVKEID